MAAPDRFLYSTTLSRAGGLQVSHVVDQTLVHFLEPRAHRQHVLKFRARGQSRM